MKALRNCRFSTSPLRPTARDLDDVRKFRTSTAALNFLVVGEEQASSKG